MRVLTIQHEACKCSNYVYFMGKHRWLWRTFITIVNIISSYRIIFRDDENEVFQLKNVTIVYFHFRCLYVDEVLLASLFVHLSLAQLFLSLLLSPSLSFSLSFRSFVRCVFCVDSMRIATENESKFMA